MEYTKFILPPLLLILFQMHLSQALPASSCPLDLSGSNFKMAASVCSNKQDIGKCCRYINAFVAVSVSRYAISTGNLGVKSSDLTQVCLRSISQTLELYGISRNATVFCGFGTKISVSYDCLGRTTVQQMLKSPRFPDLSLNCSSQLSDDRNCKKCLNAGSLYLRNLLAGGDNLTLSMCRDATFASIVAIQYVNNNNVSEAADFANCFFGVQGLFTPPDNSPSSSSSSSSTSPPSPAPTLAASPSQKQQAVVQHRAYRLTLVPAIGIAVITVSIIMLVVLTLLIRRKSRELGDDFDDIDKTAGKAENHSSLGFSQTTPKKLQDGSLPVFRKFRFKDLKKATDNFGMIIGQGGFGTVYKAQFKDGSFAAVKRMDKVSKQADDEFCREIELLARLHHRHLVSLRGFCMAKHERFLVYEYMSNGSINDYLHASAVAPLSWRTRIQIAIDVANALEYLHFYCDPPLCHRDVKSSNILLDENLIAKVADFGLAQASKDGSVSFEVVNTEISGTPGYMDPEYVITRELTEKSDVYSFGVVLLELVTARRAIQENKNLVEWSETFVSTDSTRFCELVDPNLGETYDMDQLQTLIVIVKWCTQREGRDRPSIKQVLRLLYECLDPMHSGFIEAVEGGEFEEGGGQGRMERGRRRRSDAGMFHSGDVRCLASSSSTSRSYCSRSFLLETNSPPSP
ncbi:probable receptor-like protein kinase At1g49730 [Impatiens glandulifera]|uniref:probable receptor-like protein kinase At1g49730 n=1 Tax=Impatiens glandulifera TaxID=253017 RepID=UPI001FB1780E|nr:probable receptor-like protein kinase At1g49730 [Impatiens glandulifera]